MVAQSFVVATSPVSLNPEEMSGGNLPYGDLSLLSPPSSTAFREPSLLVATTVTFCHYARFRAELPPSIAEHSSADWANLFRQHARTNGYLRNALLVTHLDNKFHHL